MTKLFKVTCLLTYVAAEEDSIAAARNAHIFAKEHLDDASNPFDLVTVAEILEADEIPPGWQQSLPYGDEADGKTKVKDYLPRP